MITAREVRDGQALRLNGELYKVVSATHHAGTGQLQGVVRAMVRHLATGRVTEVRWDPDDRVEDVALDRQPMQFLYADEQEVVFMHPETFDQVSLPRSAIERYLPFLKEGATVHLDFFEGRPVDVSLPRTVTLQVTSCGRGIRGQAENTLKEAVLENGMTVLVPQFIEEGDVILVDVETGKYVDRQRRKAG